LFKFFLKFSFGLLFLTLSLSGAAFAQQQLYIKKTKIVTTTGHIADLVRNIVGENMEVEALMGTGVDPHLWRPTRSDLVKLKKADIVFYNGLHLESQMSTLLKDLAKTKSVLAISSVLPSQDLIQKQNKIIDPHIWMNVNLWAQAIDLVVDVVSDFDEERRDKYEAAALAYRKKLDHLDYRIQVAVSTIPRKSRILITGHDAFGYFGQAYGLAVLGVQGLSTESEASLYHIENLVDIIVKQNIHAIFVENSVDKRNIQSLIEGASARGHNVKIGGSLYSDSMGAKGSFADTYIGMMVHNVATITASLGGDTNEFSDYELAYQREK